MAKSIEVTLMAYATEPSAKAAGRLLVSKDNLLQLTGALEGGRLCTVERLDGNGAGKPLVREASLWAAPEPLRRNLARVSAVFRAASGLGANDKCRITVLAAEAVSEAGEVMVVDVTTRDGVAPLGPVADPALLPLWREHVEEQLDEAELVFPGLVVRDVKRRRVRRDFVVRTVDGRTDGIARFGERTHVRIEGAGGRVPGAAVLPLRPASMRSAAVAPESRPPPRLGPLPGLDETVAQLNEFLLYFAPDGSPRVPGESCAIVLQGDAGTGKTLLLSRLAALGWGTVHAIQPGEKLAAIQEIFQRAAAQRPSIVTLDNIQLLLAEERTNRAAVCKVLAELLETHAWQAGSDDTTPQLLVVATCTNYTREIPAELRLPGRLDQAITIPFPDTDGRVAILQALGVDEALARDTSLKTHAFNGHELRSLFYQAVRKGRARRVAAVAPDSTAAVAAAAADSAVSLLTSTPSTASSSTSASSPPLTAADFAAALLSVTPGRMDGINIKPLPVYWHQIHGQAALVDALRGAVDMLNRPERYRGYVKFVPRGYLLYGPPGCSKTMAAQALATESGLNYFSVKGGELLNQYVGESERGIRELFARAKRAAPAVIFLDEIDAVAGRRSDFGDKAAATSRGPQVVPALLSELDGFEPLSKVLVVAATNRPETLDPALLRAGRLERHFYVPPPTETARRAIFATWTAGMRVSPDLDLDHLARLTDRFSGAEVVGICREVGLQARAAVAAAAASDDAEPGLMTTDMFVDRIHRTPRMITSHMVDFFADWSVSY